MEFQSVINGTTGTVHLKINGNTEFSLTGLDTNVTANNYADFVVFGEAGNGNPGSTFSDIYINDGTGAAPFNGFLGEVRCDAYFPTADGTYKEFTPNSGTDNFSRVNQTAPDDDTTFVSSSTVGARDTYVMGQITHNPSIIYASKLTSYAKKTDAGDRSLTLLTRAGGTDFDGVTTSLSNGSYTAISETRTVNPATGLAWTKAELNATEFGQKVV